MAGHPIMVLPILEDFGRLFGRSPGYQGFEPAFSECCCLVWSNILKCPVHLYSEVGLGTCDS